MGRMRPTGLACAKVCSRIYTLTMSDARPFGEYVRDRRLAKASEDAAFSLRQVAERVGIEPSYLSKIERGDQPPPGEETIRRIASELEEDADALLARAGKVSTDLLEIIRERPELVAELLRSIRRVSAKKISRISRQVRDGEW